MQHYLLFQKFESVHTNEGRLTSTMMVGAADICIEVVSPESSDRDYGKKLREYEKAGVTEYWLIDPQRHAALFYRLNDDKSFQLISLDAQQQYTTSLLPDLFIDIPTLWQAELPDIYVITESVRKMLGGG